VSLRNFVLNVQTAAGVFRFSHPRLKGCKTGGIGCRYETSLDLISWSEVLPIFETAVQIPEKPDYETATLRLPGSDIAGRERLLVLNTSTSP
jgi:hypothetical protein